MYPLDEWVWPSITREDAQMWVSPRRRIMPRVLALLIAAGCL